ncbi:hypothetical protein GP486_007779, partial [Trichoglossum hirsutum]
MILSVGEVPLTAVAELTGASQLVALLFAPIFGYLSDRYRRFNGPLLASSFTGVVGYIGFGLIKCPEPSNKDGRGGSPFIFLLVALLGISQVGAIVCSLGLLGRGVLGDRGGYVMSSQLNTTSLDDTDSVQTPTPQSAANRAVPHLPSPSLQQPTSESTPLLARKPDDATTTTTSESLSHLKGSIAGVYSLAG